MLERPVRYPQPQWSIESYRQIGLVTLIGEAVFARTLSAIKAERTRASRVIAGPKQEAFHGDKKQFIDDLEQALYASKIISYTQGFMLMRETAKELEWHLNYAGIARIWRGGCIIKVRAGRASLLVPGLLIATVDLVRLPGRHHLRL